ncbi:MAG: MBG domain-containing protein, partial [Thermoguttaceae bacterium]
TTQPTLTTTATAASHVAGSPYPITASGAVDPDYTISYVAGTLTVTAAPLTITAVNKTKVYGAALPTLTASYAGFVNGDTSASLTTQPTLITTATASSHVAGSPYPITASGAVDPDYTISYVAGTLTVTAAPLTITANNQTKVYGAPLPTLTASYAGFVNGDTSASLTTQPMLTTTATTSSPVGTYPITVSGATSPDYTITFVAGTLTVTALQTVPSVLVLDPTACGALSLSGNASITEKGAVVVDSNSKTALQASGHAQLTATAIDVVGGVQRTGNAVFHPAPVTGSPAVADPLAGLAAPPAGTSQRSVNLACNSSLTINPGLYSRIDVSGNARLKLNPGIYEIAGGGFNVSGSATVSGSGVLIYNAGSLFPKAKGGCFGGISFSGDSTITLTGPTTGAYAGIDIFQSRDNKTALQLSGSAMLSTGTLYAPSAALVMSGCSNLSGPLIVDRLSLSGNADPSPVLPERTIGFTNDGQEETTPAATRPATIDAVFMSPRPALAPAIVAFDIAQPRVTWAWLAAIESAWSSSDQSQTNDAKIAALETVLARFGL